MRRTYGAAVAAALSLVLLTACSGGGGDSAEESSTIPCTSYSEMPRNVYAGETSIELEKNCITYAPEPAESGAEAESESEVDEEVAEPEPVVTDDLILDYASADGYTGTLRFPLPDELYYSDITNAPPGFTDFTMVTPGPGVIENTTEGRQATIGAALFLTAFFSADSVVCSLDGEASQDDGVRLSKTSSSCQLNLGVVGPATLGAGESLSLPLQTTQFDTALLGIAETDEPAFSEALNSPMAYAFTSSEEVSSAPTVCVLPDARIGDNNPYSIHVFATSDESICV